MATVKINGYVVGKVKLSEINIKELEKEGFTIEIK